jgi:16S rRNA (guanine966-N2)-methyltransferase
MRVGGGEARGRRLKGAVIPGVRPTTERVRAAIFNILAEDQYLDRRVLDLFAGTGSLGIETLSRGAGWADFVERDRRQCAVIRENLAATGFSKWSEVRQGDASKSIALLPGGYSLVLLDPPYRMGAFHKILEAIARREGFLTPGAMVVAGHSRQTELHAAYGTLRRIILRQYGDNVVEFYLNETGTRLLPGDSQESVEPAW